MRLLNTRRWELKEFEGSSIPRYAILSHTWGEEEVSLQELVKALPCLKEGSTPDSLQLKRGFSKIQETVNEACGNDIDWVWIDTCCIDKTSSAELSEAINSMFRWYQGAYVCLVYLSDVEDEEKPNSVNSSFRGSRWFTRGWTLQELLAPRSLWFYSKSWSFLGDMGTLYGVIEEVTQISSTFLNVHESRRSIFEASVAQRMAWAARRNTTKTEDLAYCLLGIFDINMPLLYGEGNKAFRRLQEEIVKTSNDHSLFAWGLWDGSSVLDNGTASRQIFARTPSDFRKCNGVVQFRAWEPRYRTSTFELTARGLRIELPIVYVRTGDAQFQYQLVGLLNCRFLDDLHHLIAIPLGPRVTKESCLDYVKKFNDGFETSRFSCYPARLVHQSTLAKPTSMPLYITERAQSDEFGPEYNELGYQMIYTRDSKSIRSFSIVLLGNPDLSRYEVVPNPAVEILARGWDYIIKEVHMPGGEISSTMGDPSHVYFHYTYQGEDFIGRLEVCSPSRHRMLVTFFSIVWKMLSLVSWGASVARGIFPLVCERSVRCTFAQASKELSRDGAAWQDLKWTQSLLLRDQRLCSSVKKKSILGTDVVVVELKVMELSKSPWGILNRALKRIINNTIGRSRDQVPTPPPQYNVEGWPPPWEQRLKLFCSVSLFLNTVVLGTYKYSASAQVQAALCALSLVIIERVVTDHINQVIPMTVKVGRLQPAGELTFLGMNQVLLYLFSDR